MKTSKLVLLIGLLSVITACHSHKKSNEIEGHRNDLSVEQLLNEAEQYTYDTIYVSGIIDHVCKHGGMRFKILSTNGAQELKIELGKGFDVMNPELAGHNAKVKGILRPQQMDADMVKDWMSKMKTSHAGEENTTHYKEEFGEIQNILMRIERGEIPYYTSYSVAALAYEID